MTHPTGPGRGLHQQMWQVALSLLALLIVLNLIWALLLPLLPILLVIAVTGCIGATVRVLYGSKW